MSVFLAALRLTLRVTGRMGLRPWSEEARRLLRLILSLARRIPTERSGKLTSQQRVLRAAQRLAHSKKARQLIADAMEVPLVDAWLFQEKLRQALEELIGPRPESTS